MIQFGEGDLGFILTKDNYRYQFTWDDALWSIRMIEGEAGENISAESAAVLWCMTQKMAWRRLPSFTQFIQKYSQPINPKWRRDGEFCMPGGRFSDSNSCAESKLQRRDRIANKQWADFSEQAQNFVVGFMRGETDNNVPKAVEFATPSSTTHAGSVTLEQKKLELVWYSKGDFDPHAETGNAFFSKTGNGGTQDWPDQFVTIKFGDTNSGQASPGSEVAPQQNQQQPADAQSVPQEETELSPAEHERIQLMTHGRTAPPATKYPYYVLEDNAAVDLQVEAGKTVPLDSRELQSVYDRFYSQMMALKNVSNLDITQTVPVIEIKTIDGHDIINLSKLIFSENTKINPGEPTPLHEIFPEISLASVESLSFTVQTPGTGIAQMIIGTLKIKIHNCSAVDKDHPKGKYLSYMMKQGYHLRIKYGINTPNYNRKEAFRTMEEDFHVTQYEMEINQDNTATVSIQLMPQHTKLFNSLLVGESIPISEIGSQNGTISSQDIKNAVETSISSEATPEQRQQIIRDLLVFTQRFNQSITAIGHRQNQNPETNTIGSLLHGAISQSEIMRQVRTGQTVAPIVVENMINALRTLQSTLLTKRYERLLENNAYTFVNKGVPIISIGVGPLIFTMVKPEIDNVVNIMAQNEGLTVGQVDSVDDAEQRNSPQTRINLKFIFGNFNEDAANWAKKPISAFPVNVENIFAQLREERDVGRFGESVNNFISTINSAISEESNYVVPPEQTETSANSQDRRSRTIRRLEIPSIKYSFYPDPVDPTAWVFYIYDSKERSVRFRSLMLAVNAEETPTDDKIKEICAQLKVPWVKMGETNALIRHMGARTVADDLIATANILAANAAQMHQRQIDASLSALHGISREFLAGGAVQNTQQAVVQSSRQILPLKLEVNHFLITTAIIGYPIFVFFPLREFSGVYTALSLGHEISNGQASTKIELQIQLSAMNYRD